MLKPFALFLSFFLLTPLCQAQEGSSQQSPSEERPDFIKVKVHIQDKGYSISVRPWRKEIGVGEILKWEIKLKVGEGDEQDWVAEIDLGPYHVHPFGTGQPGRLVGTTGSLNSNALPSSAGDGPWRYTITIMGKDEEQEDVLIVLDPEYTKRP